MKSTRKKEITFNLLVKDFALLLIYSFTTSNEVNVGREHPYRCRALGFEGISKFYPIVLDL